MGVTQVEHLACSVPLKRRLMPGSQSVGNCVWEDQVRGMAARRRARPAGVAGVCLYILSPRGPRVPGCLLLVLLPVLLLSLLLVPTLVLLLMLCC